MTTVGFTCGAFDLLHAGHMLMFQECKRHCGYLLVGLHRDPSLERQEKNRPVQTLSERYTMLQGIKYVDGIEIYDTEYDLTLMLMRSKIDVRFVGEDWKDKPLTAGFLDIPIHYTKRVGYSSTELRGRVFAAEMEKRRKKDQQVLLDRLIRYFRND